eukprot:jgi/Botrbrau1/10728/Bobra.357_1s0029.1
MSGSTKGLSPSQTYPGSEGNATCSSTSEMQHPSAQAMPESGSGQSWSLQSCLGFSPFAFADAELEALYRAYVSKSLNPWMLGCTGTMITGWMLFISKFARAQWEPVEFSPPLELWLVGLEHIALLGSNLYALLLKPALYTKHQHAIKPLVMLCLMLTFPYGREILLWMRSASSKSRASIPSALQQLQMFALENVLISTMWFLGLAFSSGPVPDLAILTVSLIPFVASNRAICDSPQWGQSLVSMSPAYLSGAHAASVWVAEVGAPFFGGYSSSRTMSCPAVLGFWALVGWWMACVALSGAEISRRRAFLRTNEALASVGPAYAAAALRWPFESLEKGKRCFMAFLVLCYATSLIWNTAFPLFEGP